MLNKEVKHIDISNTPELLRLAEEVQRNNQLTILTKDGKELVKVSPAKVSKRSVRTTKTKADLEAMRSAAGGWKGLIDPEAFLEDIKAARGSDRTPVNL